MIDKELLFDISKDIGALLGRGDMDTLYNEAMTAIPEGGLAIEVGTWKGGSAVILGNVCKEKGARFICIDAFGGNMFNYAVPQAGLLSQVMFHLEGLPVEYMVGDSAKIVGYLGPQIADFIFIDGDHAYPMVQDDIEGYWEVLKRGGTYLMHDYTNPCDVKEAAQKFFVSSMNFPIIEMPDSIAKVVKV